MQALMLQDWVTVHAGATTTLVQSESGWLDVSPFQDVTFWLAIREVTSSGAPAADLTLNLQTAPAKDDRLFATMASLSLKSASTTTVTTIAVATSKFTASTSIGLSSWLRWRIVPTSQPADWDATFRVTAAFNGAMRFSPRPLAALRVRASS